MCLNPKWLYKKGHYVQDNYRGAVGDFYELGTMTKCGSCSQCMAEKSNNWVIRNHYESKKHQKKCFITLTYKESPIILVKKDLQDFIKRLRRTLEYNGYKDKIRYFAVGEYGTANNRPHMHVIIYGWKDENAKYLDISKRKNLVLHSELIDKVWGKGRTSYQEFSEHEAPYISLYSTPQETFKKAYKLNLDKLHRLEDYAKTSIKYDSAGRKNLINQIAEMRKALEDSKKKYILAKEWNTWSLALGWEEWEKQYIKAHKYVFTEYIEDCEYVTPTPWVKKMANLGDIPCAMEMFRREQEAEHETNEARAKAKAELREYAKKKDEIIEWLDKKDKSNL